MSAHSSVLLGNFVYHDYEPCWMKAERYDYCEKPVRQTPERNWFKKLISFFGGRQERTGKGHYQVKVG